LEQRQTERASGTAAVMIDFAEGLAAGNSIFEQEGDIVLVFAVARSFQQFHV
jgi:hypothetical protein